MSLRREWWEIWAIAVVYKMSLEDEVVIHIDLENILPMRFEILR